MFPGFVASPNGGLTINSRRQRWTVALGWCRRLVGPRRPTRLPRPNHRTTLGWHARQEDRCRIHGDRRLPRRQHGQQRARRPSDRRVHRRRPRRRLRPATDGTTPTGERARGQHRRRQRCRSCPRNPVRGALHVVLTGSRDLSEFVVCPTKATSSNPNTYHTAIGVVDVDRRIRHRHVTHLPYRQDRGDRPERREQFSDQTSFTSSAEVQADADVQNQLAQESYAILTELTDAQAATAIRLGIRLGDVPSVAIKGRRYRVPIESVAYDISPARQVMRSLLGTATPDELTELLRDVGGLAARFDSAKRHSPIPQAPHQTLVRAPSPKKTTATTPRWPPRSFHPSPAAAPGHQNFGTLLRWRRSGMRHSSMSEESPRTTVTTCTFASLETTRT